MRLSATSTGENLPSEQGLKQLDLVGLDGRALTGENLPSEQGLKPAREDPPYAGDVEPVRIFHQNKD